MANRKKFGIFDVFGIELEYMIVDKKTLKVRPIADLLLKEAAGEFISDFENGAIAWSNELVTHVVELKTNGPVKSLKGLDAHFRKNIRYINKLLDKHNAMLMPSAAHPFMDPYKETMLWPHEYSEIYSIYDRIFDCRGHGWANLQSVHINLPFKNDEEFGRLHAAVRVILPLIPALAASSPILDSKFNGFKDARMETYLHNQEKIPSLTGKLIPERAYSEAEYYKKIFNKIIRDIKPYDKENVTDHHFLNSRGAIARFDRNAIEIRVVDIQECPAADIAIAEAIVGVTKMLAFEKWTDLKDLKAWHEDRLKEIFMETIKDAENTIIRNKKYLKLLGIDAGSITASELWAILIKAAGENISPKSRRFLKFILNNGTLATRMLKRVNNKFTHRKLVELCNDLSVCLVRNDFLRI